MQTLKSIQTELQKKADPEKAAFHAGFFKTGKGQYAEGDIFLGISVPVQRQVANRYKALSLSDIEKLLHSAYHEYRLTALLILVRRFEKGTAEERETVYNLYMSNLQYINNWDLVDASAHKIVGSYILLHPEKQTMLCFLAKSDSLWERRIAIISTFAYIKKGKLDLPLKISEILLHDEHDLIHKAVGWMLREVGKVDSEVEQRFLDTYARTMPRTMLRYAIERLNPEVREQYMRRQ